MKLEVVWRKGSDYVRYDLKEIAFPSSLPDPPRIRKRRILTWKERYLAVAARGGMEKLRRALQWLYMTRASAYRDGPKNFIEGYQEGIKEIMENTDDSESQRKEDT